MRNVPAMYDTRSKANPNLLRYLPSSAQGGFSYGANAVALTRVRLEGKKKRGTFPVGRPAPNFAIDEK